MHFGKIVKEVAHAQDLSAADFSELFGNTEREMLELYEQEDWKSNDIKTASVA